MRHLPKPKLLLAASLLSLSLAAAAAAADLTPQGWRFIAETEDAAVFMKASDGGAPHRRLLTAYELDAPREREGFSFRSVQSLGEYDCALRRSRVIEESFHAEEGLKGKAWQAPDFVPTDWAEPASGTIGEMRMDFACPR